MNLKTLALTAAAMLAAGACAAQSPTDTLATQKTKFKIVPTGRLLMDGGVFITNDTQDFKDGVDVPDVGVGVLGTYGDWTARIDIGYAFGKVALKDVYVEKKFTPAHTLRFGYFVHQFGLESMRGSALKVTMEEPTVSEAFTDGRLLGVMYNFNDKNFHASVSAHAESKAINLRANEMGETGYGAMTRLVYRPIHDGLDVAQVGFSAAVSGAQYNDDPELNHKIYEVTANFPTRIDQISAVNATVTDARNMFKFSPELLLCKGNLALESQYYWLQVSRKELPAYRAYGAYGMLRWLAWGGTYSYNQAGACLNTLQKKCLELVACYNYTCLSSESTGIYGGRVGDVSLTANWHLNKYMIWRLRAAYTHRFDRSGAPDVNLGAIQTRFQIIF